MKFNFETQEKISVFWLRSRQLPFNIQSLKCIFLFLITLWISACNKKECAEYKYIAQFTGGGQERKYTLYTDESQSAFVDEGNLSLQNGVLSGWLNRVDYTTRNGWQFRKDIIFLEGEYSQIECDNKLVIGVCTGTFRYQYSEIEPMNSDSVGGNISGYEVNGSFEIVPIPLE